MTFETITYSLDEGLAVISLARPKKRNAMDLRTFQELGEASERAASDPDVRGVLVLGEGPSFCAGIDLSALAGLAAVGGDTDRFREFGRVAQRPYRTLASMGKPAIAAVQGHALGAGFQLMLACDVRVAASDAVFGVLEARFGLIPDLGGLFHLVREIGPARAKELTWSARTFDAAEAERLGLVSRVVDPDQLHDAGRELAREVLAHSPVTARLVKGLASRASQISLDAELAEELEAQSAAISSEDHREAVAAFLEKRQPRFQGR